MDSVLVYIALAVVMFLIVNLLGRRSESFGYMSLELFARPDEAPAFNFAFRVATPVVIIIIVSAGFYLIGWERFTRNIYLSVVYYCMIRLGVNLAMERARLLNWQSLLPQMAISILLAWVANKYFIADRAVLLPRLDSLGQELWLGVIIFLYFVSNKVRLPGRDTFDRKSKFLRRRYAALSARYDDVVIACTTSKWLQALIYSVMIVESFNRPWIHRQVERIGFRLGLAKTLGIMQVQSEHAISDRDSVRLGAKKLAEDHAEVLRQGRPEHRWMARHEVLVRYNYSGDYARDVESVHDFLLSEYYNNNFDWMDAEGVPPV